MIGENKAMVRQFREALWNRTDFKVVDDLLARDYDGHSSTIIHGQAVRHRVRETFPDFRFRIVDQIAENDQVAASGLQPKYRAVHTVQNCEAAAPAAMAPNGREIQVDGITVFRLANSKLIEGWANEDLLGMLRQLGAIPAADLRGDQ